jgi:hypothetical protein
MFLGEFLKNSPRLSYSDPVDVRIPGAAAGERITVPIFRILY